MNNTLDHQMKALRNEKKKNSELKVRKDGFKKVMEDICFLTKCEKKNCEGHPHSPREEKKNTQQKKKSMQAKHKFFLFVTYIYKRSETTYKFKKNVYVQLFTAKKMV